MADSLCFCSAKGGTGKTAIAASCARVLADLGLRILLIDADSATNGLTMLLLRNYVFGPEMHGGGLYDSGPVRTVQVGERLAFLPAYSMMPQTWSGGPLEEERVSERIVYVMAEIAPSFDVVVIDAEAGVELKTYHVVSRARRAVIVTEFDPMSATGVERLRASLFAGRPYEDSYILVNKILPELAKIQSEYFLAWRHLPPIPFDFDVMRAYAKGRLPVVESPQSAFTIGLVRAMRELFPDVESDLDEWAATRLAEAQKPLREQLREVEEQIEAIEADLVRRRNRLMSDAYFLSGPAVRAQVAFAQIVGGAAALIVGVVVAARDPLDPFSWGLVVFGLIIAMLGVGAGYGWLQSRAATQVRQQSARAEAERLEKLSQQQLEHLRQRRDQLIVLLETDAHEPRKPNTRA